MIFEKFLSPSTRNFSYLIGNEESGECAVIDPSMNGGRITSFLEESQLTLRYIILTHSHPDHTMDAKLLSKKTGAQAVVFKDSPTPGELRVEDGSILEVGGLTLRVLHTPGHTPDSLCIRVEGLLFTGDTLFIGDCGRTDLPGGDTNALFHSLQKLLSLPDETLIHPGHDYGTKPQSTLSHERKRSHVFHSLKKGLKHFQEFMMTP